MCVIIYTIVMVILCDFILFDIHILYRTKKKIEPNLNLCLHSFMNKYMLIVDKG